MFTDKIIAMLEAEAETLRQQIAAANHQLAHVITAMKLMREIAERSHGASADALVQVGDQATVIQAKLGVKSGHIKSIKDQILDTTELVLEDGQRRDSRSLLTELAKRGVEVRGTDPMTNLASYLSKEKERFQSDRKLGGWTLTRLTKRARPSDALTSLGLFSRSIGAGERPHTQG